MGVKLDRLQQYLMGTDPGPIKDVAHIETLLAEAWDELDRSSEGGMTSDKLGGRMENVTWDSPELSFDIERHGGTVMGSRQAEIQSWCVDLQRCRATVTSGRYRQIAPRDKPLDVKPLAQEIASLIVEEKKEERLKWYAPDKVGVIIGKIIPDVGTKATIQGRRKRFHNVLSELLRPHGWKRVPGSPTYERQTPTDIP